MISAFAFSWSAVIGGCVGPNPAYTGPANSGRSDALDVTRDGASSGPRTDSARANADLGSKDLPPVSDVGASDSMTVDGAVVVRDAGTSEPPIEAPPPAPDGPAPLLHYDFETGPDGWQDLRFEHYNVNETRVVSSDAIAAHRGTRVLEMAIRTPNASVLPTFGVRTTAIKNLKAGTRIRHWVWFPAGTQLKGVQGFVYYHQIGKSEPAWKGSLILIEYLVPGTWNRIDHEVPPDVDYASGGVIDLGIEWNGNVAQSQLLKVYVDDVTITPP